MVVALIRPGVVSNFTPSLGMPKECRTSVLTVISRVSAPESKHTGISIEEDTSKESESTRWS